MGELINGSGSCPKQANVNIVCPAADTANELLQGSVLTSTVQVCASGAEPGDTWSDYDICMYSLTNGELYSADAGCPDSAVCGGN
ncbi:hypothetical protein CALCODRAFT_521583 [Calocera cornea HHB12733]|uniref:Uncharacterized protein n=1 Tax=Calocera cornea HHB12733 TaxID=1353952 RepID=A0A165CND8_9BASI|nr:hypothetical protein CALCODRAFT_521583 [Calocera cornea HHB12733]